MSSLMDEALLYARMGRPMTAQVVADLSQAVSVDKLKEAAQKRDQYPMSNPFGDLHRLHQKLARRQVPLRGLQYGEIQPAAGSSVRIRASIQQGIPMEKAREIMKMIKGSKVKVQASIQGDLVRVSSRDRDTLQEIIQLLRDADFGVDFHFTNYRTN